MAVYCVYVCFSSRRRHTRCYRDWSSEVCSSDLSAPWARASATSVSTSTTQFSCRRSEERRVGEEGRSRGSPYHLKKKNETRRQGDEGQIGGGAGHPTDRQGPRP